MCFIVEGCKDLLDNRNGERGNRLAVNATTTKTPFSSLSHHLISANLGDKNSDEKFSLRRGQLVSKMGLFGAVLLGWSGVSAVDSARLSGCPTSSIPTTLVRRGWRWGTFCTATKHGYPVQNRQECPTIFSYPFF